VKTTIALLIALSVVLAFGILFCVFVWWLVLKIARMLGKHIDVGGSTPAIRIVALGVTAWYFPSAAAAPVNALIAFVKPFLEKLPQHLAQIHTGSPAEYEALLSGASSIFVASITGFLQALEPHKLILAIALWVFVGQILSVCLHPASTFNWGRMLELPRRLSHATWVNIALVAILVFGCYLSIAAIASIPWMRQSAEPDSAEIAKLSARLSESRLAQGVLTNPPPAEPTGFSELRLAIKEKRKSLPAGTTVSGLLNDLPAIDFQLDRLWSQRSDLLTKYKDLQQKAQLYQDTLRTTAISRYGTIGRRGKQERARYYSELDSWYRSQLQGIEHDVSMCANSIANFDLLVNSFGGLINTAAFNPNAALTTQAVAFGRDVERNLTPSSCTLRVDDTPPDPSKPGSDWGPFTFVASWLLRTQSLDLALITGMLGFGFFGSAISRFVRRQSSDGSGTAAVTNDLSTVVISGLSAAIVVFLASQGGLAIFSGSEAAVPAEPNPYVLLLTCLVAAVFSEDIWRRVRKRFQQEDDGANTGGTQNAALNADDRK
jgi:hypothetical protein